MALYLVTHSLLTAWLYCMRDGPESEERDPYEDFLRTLKREPTKQTPAMIDGQCFEDLVTGIVKGDKSAEGHKWYAAAAKIADTVRGGQLQYKAKRKVRIGKTDYLLYGRLDCLKGGHIYDIKYSKGYDRGKYFNSTQHPMYLDIVPEAQDFEYLISNGSDVWTETYRRDETASIYPVIADFEQWLTSHDLIDVYHDRWSAL